MPRGRKKKEPTGIVLPKKQKPVITDKPIKNCCYWPNCNKYCQSERIFLCCAFCSLPNCSARCKDYKNGCSNLTDNTYHNIPPYSKYQKVINFKEKKEDTQEVVKKEEHKIEVKRGRGRPKKV